MAKITKVIMQMSPALCSWKGRRVLGSWVQIFVTYKLCDFGISLCFSFLICEVGRIRPT